MPLINRKNSLQVSQLQEALQKSEITIGSLRKDLDASNGMALGFMINL